MRDVLVRNLSSRFQAYADLVQQVDEAALGATLDVPKHKALRDHLWCVVGTRESFVNALIAGQWSGFSCSMNAFGRDDFATKLEATAKAALGAIEAVRDWTPPREELLAMLCEHEVMHEGQIIRHVYALQKSLPASWKWA